MSPPTPIPRPPAASMSARAPASRSPSMSLTTTTAPSADLRRTHQLDAPELLVVVALLDHARDRRVAPEVLHLLALGLGLEGDATLQEPVPHGHGVDRAVMVDRAQRHRAPAVDELVDLGVGHLDDVALLDAVAHRSLLSHEQR